MSDFPEGSRNSFGRTLRDGIRGVYPASGLRIERKRKRMRLYNIAVVGATGLVGRKMIQVLGERHFPVGSIKFLASERSVGKEVQFGGTIHPVEKLTERSFTGIEIALFSAGATVSKEFVPHAVKAGTLVIDNSSAFCMDATAPLVVPEVNRKMIFHHKGIIAIPNCSTIQMVVALALLLQHISPSLAEDNEG